MSVKYHKITQFPDGFRLNVSRLSVQQHICTQGLLPGIGSKSYFAWLTTRQRGLEFKEIGCTMYSP